MICNHKICHLQISKRSISVCHSQTLLGVSVWNFMNYALRLQESPLHFTPKGRGLFRICYSALSGIILLHLCFDLYRHNIIRIMLLWACLLRTLSCILGSPQFHGLNVYPYSVHFSARLCRDRFIHSICIYWTSILCHPLCVLGHEGKKQKPPNSYPHAASVQGWEVVQTMSKHSDCEVC